MTDKEEVTKTAAAETNPFKAMRNNIERVLEAGKKAVNAAAAAADSNSNSSSSSSSSSGSGSDSDMDPDINISLKAAAETEEKTQEDTEPHISQAEEMKEKNEKYEKEVTDRVRDEKQKKAVKRSEILAAAAEAELGAISGCSGSEGPEIEY